MLTRDQALAVVCEFTKSEGLGTASQARRSPGSTRRRRQPIPSKALDKSIRQRHAKAKSPISIRLGPDQIAAAKKIAEANSVGYQTQLRMWIAEGIRREAKRA
jgi:hypothetical protein